MEKNSAAAPGAEEDVLDQVPCSAGHSACYISPYGDVYPCVQFPLPSGNIRQQKFIDIWQHSPQLKEVRSIRARDLPVCSTCSHVGGCTRCPGLAYMEGNMRGPSTADCEKSYARTGIPSANMLRGDRAAGMRVVVFVVLLPSTTQTASRRRATILAIVRCDRRATYFRANRAWTVWIVEEEQKPRRLRTCSDARGPFQSWVFCLPSSASAQVEERIRQMNGNQAEPDLWIETLKRSGFGIATVAGGCMSPVLDVGDKAYVELSDPSCCRVGDIVVFPVADSLTLHRIVGRLWTPHGKLLVHRGDKASSMAFGLIRQERILGRLIIVKRDRKVVLASAAPQA